MRNKPPGEQKHPISYNDRKILPRSVVTFHTDLFKDSDAKGRESMVLCFGPRASRAIEMSTVVVVDHKSGPLWVETVVTGEVMWNDFAARNPHLVLVGWCHSHHTLQGTPSVIDLRNHWLLQSQIDGDRRLLMGISFLASVSEETAGMRAWIMPKHIHQKLTACQGQIAEAEDPLDHLTTVKWRAAEYEPQLHVLEAMLPDVVALNDDDLTSAIGPRQKLTLASTSSSSSSSSFCGWPLCRIGGDASEPLILR